MQKVYAIPNYNVNNGSTCISSLVLHTGIAVL